ncbi:MAG TPA: extracellular solute-binding protein, partial [Bauldia sp.]|nr:extracellular solute-binding protein [Bauldia sp.]
KGREDAIKILTWMQNAIYTAKFANPDSATFQTGQVSDYFLSGASAMAYGWLSDYWAFMQNPENIKQVGPVGAFRFPSFTGSDSGGFSSWWVMGIPKDAKHPDAAWEFIKWTLNEHPQVDMAAGQLEGYVCDGIASWDVMAALPILESLGYACSLDWSRVALTDKIGFACGTAE